jgi:hypothetical protein
MPRGKPSGASLRRARERRDRLSGMVRRVQEETGMSLHSIAPEIGYSHLQLSRHLTQQSYPRDGEQYQTALELLQLLLDESSEARRPLAEWWSRLWPAALVAGLGVGGIAAAVAMGG